MEINIGHLDSILCQDCWARVQVTSYGIFVHTSCLTFWYCTCTLNNVKIHTLSSVNCTSPTGIFLTFPKERYCSCTVTRLQYAAPQVSSLHRTSTFFVRLIWILSRFFLIILTFSRILMSATIISEIAG